jgi:hypothetical protein
LPKTIAKTARHAHVSLKIHRHLKKQGRTNVSLKDIHQSLSNIGVSLSKRVIEEREKH